LPTSGPTARPIPLSPLEPLLTPEEREELTCLAYLAAELEKLRDRGLISEDSFETVRAETRDRKEAIDRGGRYKAELAKARQYGVYDPRMALQRAELARSTDPTKPEAWLLAIELCFRLREDARGADLCDEAARQSLNLSIRSDYLARARRVRETSGSPIGHALAQARLALEAGDDEAVLSLCTPVLAEQPENVDALAFCAFALKRQERTAEALALYRKLQQAEPDNEAWTKWVHNLEAKGGLSDTAKPPMAPATDLTRTLTEVATSQSPSSPPAPRSAPVPRLEPALSWSTIAGEFLQDHWQKLFLCLAVLLIVVSSNVGAYQLLGPKLWSPVGKCMLALVYTAMFAGFGAGLVKWGAERSGRIMLLTTLFVVPADFMLAGQMKLLTEPSASRLAVLGLDVVALFLLIRLVASRMGMKQGGLSLSIALFALSVFNVAVAPGLTWPWSWQFAMFLAPAFVFLAAVSWAITRLQSHPLEGRHETTYFVLGIFVFAFLTGAIRTGVFALHLVPALYSVPLMVTAIACVHTARRMGKFDPDPAHEAWLSYGGLVASGLAFALALARPPGFSALYSGNLLAVALMGLALYAAMLVVRRHPAYIYLGFGALFLTYFGAFYFVVDLIRTVEHVVASALGYEKLPFAFKSLNGLAFNSILALLSVYFSKRWHDPRLARHCHYIGVPFSIAACLLSTFEPKAALLCLSGYTILYALAVWIFRSPRVLYLATSALAGAVHFGLTFLPGAVPAIEALVLAVLGLGYWIVATILKLRLDKSYTIPLTRSALSVATLAMVVALLTILTPPPVELHVPSLAAAAALLVGTIVIVLANRNEPRAIFAAWATAGLNFAYVFFVLAAQDRWGFRLGLHQYGIAAASAGFVLAALGSWLRGLEGPELTESHLSLYPTPLDVASFLQLLIAIGLCGDYTAYRLDALTAADFANMAAALAFCGVAFTILLRHYRFLVLANVAISCGLVVWMCLVRTIPATQSMPISGYAAAVSAFALLLFGLLEAGRLWTRRQTGVDPDFATVQRPTTDVFLKAIPDFLISIVLIAAAMATVGFTNGPAVIFTFAAGALASIGSTRSRRRAPVVDLGLCLGVVGILCQTSWVVGWSDPGFCLSIQAIISALLAGALWWVSATEPIGRWLDLDLRPCYRTARALTWLMILPALVGAGLSSHSDWWSALALVINTLALVLMTTTHRWPSLTYQAVGSVVLAVYVVVFSLGSGSPDTAHVPGLVAAILALVTSAVGFAVRAYASRGNRSHWEVQYGTPLFRWALVMTVVAVATSYWSPVSMGLVAISFVVMVKSLPGRGWLYPAVAASACALYCAWLKELPQPRLVTAAIVGAYQLWLIGLGLRRYEPRLKSWLKLPNTGYDQPLYNSAILAAIIAVGIRINLGLLTEEDWFEAAGLALNLSGFCLLMIKAYPSKGWVHASVLLLTVSTGMEAYPRVTAPLTWLLIGMGLAIALVYVAKIARRFAATLCQRLGIPEDDYAGVVELWSNAYFTITSALTLFAVVGSMILTITHQHFPFETATLRHWWMILAAIGLGSVYVISAWAWTRRAETLMGLWAWLTLAVWWAGASISPLVVRLGMDGARYEPLASASLALVTTAIAVFFTRRSGWRGAFWKCHGEVRERLDASAIQAGPVLAVLAALMTLGSVQVSTVVTLVIVSASLGLAAVARRSILAGYATAIAWSATGLLGSLVLARRYEVTSPADEIIWVALGTFFAVGTLWALAGVLRKGLPLMEPGEETDLPAGTVPLALEQVGLLATLFCGGAVVCGGFFLARPGTNASMTAVGILFGLALFDIALIRRWRSEWLVYLAEIALATSYLYYRWIFPVPSAIDASILSLFGYLSLGLAELLGRIGLSRYSRATRYSSLVLPILPIALTLWEQGLNDSNLFVLFAAASFYGVASAQMRWRSLAYASGVLFNAALWLLWGRLGWQVVDHTQYYLIPVGLSAVLFAEVNRQSLGRDVVNTLRGVGLTVIYASLAVPIWQHQSLGAWVFLLFASLAGIVVGIGLRVQTFLWLGLVGFVLDVLYQLGKFGMENPLAKWSIMLSLGVGMVVFVALNEKKRIVMTLRTYFETARQWE
jgi:hypothetical protein